MAHITQLPGAGAQVGQALAGLGRGVSQIISPNQERRRALKDAIAANPELASQLALLGPEVLEGLGLGDVLTGTIGATPLSADALLEQLRRRSLTGISPKIQGELEEFLRAKAVGTTPVELARQPPVAAGIRRVATDKDLVQRAAERELTGQTAGQRARDDLVADVSVRAQTAVSSLPKDVAGEGSIRATLPGFFGREDLQARLDAQLQLFNARSLADFLTARDRLFLTNAIDSAQRDPVASVPAWQAYYQNPGRALALSRGEITPENDIDTELIAIINSRRSKSVTERIEELAIVNQGLETALGLLEGLDADDPEARGLIDTLNSFFLQAHDLGAPRFTVNVGLRPSKGVLGTIFENPSLSSVIPFVGGGGEPNDIFITDEGGNEVSPETAVAATLNFRGFGRPTPAETPATPATVLSLEQVRGVNFEDIQAGTRTAISRILTADDPQEALDFLIGNRPDILQDILGNIQQ